MKLQHQADPVYGVEHWDMLQQSCEVLTAVPSEPRKEMPFAVVRAILEALDPSVEWEAQFGFFMLTLLFTFSRSECPCPKAFTGEQSFDPEQHWQVGDFSFEIQEMVRSEVHCGALQEGEAGSACAAPAGARRRRAVRRLDVRW
jgi:hypothetical protein